MKFGSHLAVVGVLSLALALQKTPSAIAARPVEPQTVNLLTNAGFETGSLTGWEMTGSMAVAPTANYAGTYGVSMNLNGRIDQVFATVVGRTYTVTARLRINAQPAAPAWGGLRVQVVNASWAQLAVSPTYTTANSPLGQWTAVQVTFVATTATSRVLFQNFSGGTGQFLADADEFTVTDGLTIATATPTAAATATSTVTQTPVVASPTATQTVAVATPTSTPTSATTFTPTASATPSAVSATPTTAVTTPPGTTAFTYFPVGLGSTDVIPHQIVRTAEDRVYIFTSQQYTSALRAYWSTTPGLPTAATVFGTTIATEPGLPISVETAYDGARFIHVLVNLNNGQLKDYVFDTVANAFRAPLALAAGNPTVTGDYIGTSGVSALFDNGGRLQVAYWSAGSHITQQGYTYDASGHALSPVTALTQLDALGSANHPVLAVSPVDDSLTVAWVSEATNPARILARSWSSAAGWGSVETISTAPVWTSTYFGINIDQGPSLVIDASGTRRLLYMETYDGSGDYGRVHSVVNAGTGWVDQALPVYTHDPALAITGSGELYVLGHGHPVNAQVQSGLTTCLSMDEMCALRIGAGAWPTSRLVAPRPATEGFDSSPSVKWSVVGFNRPETIEFVFFSTPYSSPTVYYARFDGGVAPQPTATPSATNAASATPTGTATHTAAPSVTPPPTATHTDTPAPSATTDPTATDTPVATGTLDPSATVAPTMTDTPAPSATTEPTVTDTPAATGTLEPSATVAPTMTDTAAPSATVAPTSTTVPTATPPALPTNTPTHTATPPPTLTATATAGAADTIFSNGFEGGSLAAWTANNNDGGNLSVSAVAALEGAFGLQALINDNTAVYVQDDTPTAETRYRARFSFDPNTIAMGNNDMHPIFMGYSGTATQVLRVEFRRSAGAYQLRTSLFNDGNAWTNSNWFTITDAPHAVELDWRASSAPGANGGALTFWLDGAQVAALAGVDNDTRRIDRARLGPLAGIDTSTRGTERFDSFVSRRTTYIGTDTSSPVTPTATPAAATATPTTAATATAAVTPVGPTAAPSATPTPGSAGFPAQPVLDSFNRADGGLGGAWAGATGGYAIVNNQVNAGSGGAIFQPVLFGAAQEAYVTLTQIDPTAAEIDLLLKSQSSTTWGNGVLEVWYQPALGRVQVWTYSPAQGWVQRGADLPVTFAAGDRFGARVSATGLVEVYRNDTLLGTRDAGSWTFATSSGYVGVWLDNAGATRLDDFGGGP